MMPNAFTVSQLCGIGILFCCAVALVILLMPEDPPRL